MRLIYMWSRAAIVKISIGSIRKISRQGACGSIAGRHRDFGRNRRWRRQDLTEIAGDAQRLVPLTRMAQGYFLEPGTVDMVGASDVQMALSLIHI